jgi:hypothetical protein
MDRLLFEPNKNTKAEAAVSFSRVRFDAIALARSAQRHNREGAFVGNSNTKIVP